MSCMLRLVPTTNPANPMHPIKKFRKSIHALAQPDVVYQRVQLSKNAGNSIPNIDSVKAPMNEMKMSKFGITSANATIKEQTTKKKNVFSERLKTMLKFMKKLTSEKNKCGPKNVITQ